jgi:16S rRNA processing protein RimM
LTDWVAVGRVIRAHGIQGEVIVHRFGDADDMLAPGRELRFGETENSVSRVVVLAQPHGREWRVRFEGVSDRNEAELLRGAWLYVSKDVLPELPEGSFYRFQLLGLAVRTEEGKALGRVEDILEAGPHDVCVVRGEEGEVLIPAVGALVRVDLERGEMVVHALPGLVPGAEVDREDR